MSQNGGEGLVALEACVSSCKRVGFLSGFKSLFLSAVGKWTDRSTDASARETDKALRKPQSSFGGVES